MNARPTGSTTATAIGRTLDTRLGSLQLRIPKLPEAVLPILMDADVEGLIGRSSGLVTGMMIAVCSRLVGANPALAYGAIIRDEGHWEHVKVGRPFHKMSCELALVAGRPCDLPGCAASADP
jgi:hypothetical protein